MIFWSVILVIWWFSYHHIISNDDVSIYFSFTCEHFEIVLLSSVFVLLIFFECCLSRLHDWCPSSLLCNWKDIKGTSLLSKWLLANIIQHVLCTRGYFVPAGWDGWVGAQIYIQQFSMQFNLNFTIQTIPFVAVLNFSGEYKWLKCAFGKPIKNLKIYYS